MKKNKNIRSSTITRLSFRDISYCLEAGKSITAQRDPELLFSLVHRYIIDAVPAHSCTIFLYDSKRSLLTRAVSSFPDGASYSDIRLSTGKGIAGHVAKTGKMMLVREVARCRHFSQAVDSPDAASVKCIISLPLRIENVTKGVMSLVNPRGISDTKISLLTGIADFTAIAMENTELYDLMKSKAFVDGLTGLYNTRYLYRALEQIAADSMKEGKPFSVIFMDLDDFKHTVDSYGHLNGSQAIQEVAMTIQDELKKPEFAVSYGGDEFVIVLPECKKRDAVKRAAKILNRMGRTVYLANRGLSVSLSASFGIASFPDDTTDTRRLMDLADSALFTMKASGKNGVMGIFDLEENP